MSNKSIENGKQLKSINDLLKSDFFFVKKVERAGIGIRMNDNENQ